MPLGERLTVADPVLLRRTSTVCFASGLYLLAMQTVGFIWVFALGFQYALLENSTVSAIIACVWLTYIVLSVFFAFYLFKVGGAYSLTSLKATALAFLGVLFAEFTPAVLIKFYPPWSLYSGFWPVLSPGVSQLASLFSWLLVAFYVAFALLFIWGAMNMKDETGLRTFGTAETLMLAGLLVPYAFPIGIMVFASGLQKVGASR